MGCTSHGSLSVVFSWLLGVDEVDLVGLVGERGFLGWGGVVFRGRGASPGGWGGGRTGLCRNVCFGCFKNGN